MSAIDETSLERERAHGRQGEWPAGFDALVRSHSARLVRGLTLITLDRGAAEDAAQEAFLQLYLHWNQAPGMRDPVAWLYRVGMNRCKNYRRAVNRAARAIERLGHSMGEDSSIGEWSTNTELTAIVRHLPKRQRTAVALHYVADLSAAEIARTMGISEGAVGSHLYKARESLRKMLEAE